MRCLRLLIGASLSALAVGLVVPVLAGALPLVLPETLGKSWTGVSIGETLLESASGARITCSKVTGEATEESPKPEGTFHVRLMGCTSQVGGFTVKCTGLGDANAGENLILGTYHLVYEAEELHEDHAAGLPVGILGLVTTNHYVCGAVALFKTEGSEICLILNPYVLKELFEAHCYQNNGVSENGKYLNDKGEVVKAELKLSTNEGGSVSAADLGLAFGSALLNGKEIDVLIMMN